MQISQIVITVVITLAVVAAVIFTTAASVFPRTAEAHGFGGWHGQGAGHGRQHGGGHGNHCARLEMPVGKLASVMIEETLTLNETQRKELEPLTTTLEAWRKDAQVQCDAFDHNDVAAALSSAETMLRTSADRVAQLQPAYASFYESLDEAQKTKLKEILQHQHGRTE